MLLSNTKDNSSPACFNTVFCFAVSSDSFLVYPLEYSGDSYMVASWYGFPFDAQFYFRYLCYFHEQEEQFLSINKTSHKVNCVSDIT